MGGCLSNPARPEETAEAPPKQYSWDKRRQELDPKDYTYDGLKGETVGKTPGQLNGQQFTIQNCEDCNIYIFDHVSTVQIDDCVNCRIFVGPVKQSLFIRDCKDCKLMTACQQFRTRDCKKIDIFLSCVTQPIIESSTGMKFASFQFSYPQLEDQFKSSQISIYNNNWSSIHDFTPVDGENNHSLLPEDAKVEDYIPIPTIEHFQNMQLSTDSNKSVVPRTLGSRRKPSDQSCLVVFFNDGGSQDRAKRFIEAMRQYDCVLVQTKEMSLKSEDAERVFGTDAYNAVASTGPVIGFEYNGDGVVERCQEQVVTVSQGTTGMVFVSQNHKLAAQQIDNFYNFAEMQMAV
ncbi:unnamed protein product [Owenia fusiformis]|uniref:Protein XRP2 n=1 Tax=Owenia fusiformis TaxID=6347 RepID=A0A8J1Y2E3_OWEFU|nr:unnamed protein product [Owenia fusiformis]